VPQYLDTIMSFIDPAAIQAVHVVADAGSGMAGARGAFDVRVAAVPGHAALLRDRRDVPNHEANPSSRRPRDITAEVIRRKADVGIAWDGDADRCFFLDGKGEFISGDFITGAAAEAFLLKHRARPFIYDLRASRAVKEHGPSVSAARADEPRRSCVHQAPDAREERSSAAGDRNTTLRDFFSRG